MNLTDFVSTKVLAMFLSTVMTLSTTPNSGVTYYGECSVTAYSGTPGVTYGASGNTLEPWKSVAGSRSTLPLGTLLFVEDIGFVIVEDRLSEWYEIENDHMVIDIFVNDYDEACEWGRQEKKVYIISIPNDEKE